MEFRIIINTTGAAFENEAGEDEVRRILSNIAGWLYYNGKGFFKEPYTLYDIDGNSVGQVVWSK